MKSQLIVISIIFLSLSIQAQDDNSKEVPERAAFESSILIDNQTVVTPFKNSFEFQIHHRFGKMNNGISDIFGVYAPSNIRLGLNYGLSEKIMLGIGTTKDYKLQDFQWKYLILQQTKSGSMPVSLSYYGNYVIDARSKDSFGPEEEFKSAHRFSYFTQLIVAKRINFKYSLQVAPSFFYYNAVEEGMKNGNFGISAGARARVIGSSSIIAEYHQLLTEQPDFEPKPNLALGIEFSSATHAFHVFVANYSQIINQRNLLYNTNDLTEGDFLLGFNITVRF